MDPVVSSPSETSMRMLLAVSLLLSGVTATARQRKDSSVLHLLTGDVVTDPSETGILEDDMMIEHTRRGSYSTRNNRDSRKGGRHPRHRTLRAATARKDRLWPHAVIPYEIEANFSGEHRALFKQAMRYWESETCIQFVERTPSLHPDYIIFTERACGCCSFVGRRGNGAQAISIGKNCDKFGIVVHELGHVVGFWHEHTRPDRDRHVHIIPRNIVAGQEYNFNKLAEDEVDSLGLGYDYESIMHYAKNTFSRSTSLDTILPVRRNGLKMGQRVRLSPGDIQQTNRLYKCPECGGTYQAPSGSIRSPSFETTVSFGERQHCEWRISATQGERIALEFTHLDMEPSCEKEYLEIRDGYWNRSPLIGRFCGSQIPVERLVSTGYRIQLIYHSTSSHHRGFQAEYEAVCGGILDQAEGTLQSPNYPDEYSANKECIWRIRVNAGSQVALTFRAFQVEYHDNCVYDFVEVRDGFTLHSPLLARLCGYEIPNEIRSTTHQLFIRFVSDSSVPKMGFSANFVTEVDECATSKHGCQQRCVNTVGSYRCECDIGFELRSDGKRCEDACGGVLKMGHGVIMSPSFPELYPSNKVCIWEIFAPEHFRITLNFTHFDVEGTNQECEYDSVDVLSRPNSDVWRRQGRFCGSRSPPPITSEGNALRVEFVSDSSVQRSGFAALYFTDQDECASNNAGCQQICKNTVGSYQCSCYSGFVLHSNGHDCKEGSCIYKVSSTEGVVSSPNYPDQYPSRKECTWKFETTPGHRIKLVFDSFELEPHQECAYDHVVLYDGDSSDAPLLGRFCGSKTPHPILSTARYLRMTFQSDSSVQRTGFHAIHSTVCGGRLSAGPTSAVVYSHTKYGDQDYGARVECNWILTAPGAPGRVRIRFESFDVEPEQDCAYDFVQVSDGFETGPSLGRFCGSELPPPMTSSGFRLLVRFQSDDSVAAKGFVLSYQEVFS